MKEVEYRDLAHGTVDPNRARWYWLGGSVVGVLFAFLTVKTNWDYFAQFYTGFAFWARAIPFLAVEAIIVILPLFKGFGGKAQGNAAFVCELLLVVGALTHTYLVSDTNIAKLQAGKTKTEASADFDRAQAVADRVKADNAELQRNHNRQMELWNGAVRTARREGRSAPEPPQAPKLQDVPQVNQAVVNNATMSVETAGEARVSHSTLQQLLFLLVGMVALSVMAVISLADGSRIKSWLLRQRAEEIKSHTTGRPLTLRQPISMAPKPITADAAETRPLQDFEARSRKPGLLRRWLTR